MTIRLIRSWFVFFFLFFFGRKDKKLVRWTSMHVPHLISGHIALKETFLMNIALKETYTIQHIYKHR